MFIEVADDIVQDAVNSVSYEVNQSLDVLQALALAVMYGNHIVYVPYLKKEKAREEFGSLLGKRLLAMLGHYRTNIQDTGYIMRRIHTKIVVSYASPTIENGIRIIHINPRTLQAFAFYEKTFLLTENLLDAEFYKKIFLFYKKRILDMNSGNSCAFYPLMGGGATSAKVLEGEILQRQHLCLAIADSDKYYPDDKEGQTAGNMRAVLNSYPTDLCHLYVMKNVREIENLIPHRLLKETPNHNTNYNEKMAAIDMDYYDIKCGISVKSMYKDKVCDYWRQQFHDKDFSEVDTLKKQHPQQRAYMEQAKLLPRERNVIVDISWGASVLNSVVDTLGHKLSEIQTEDLTPNQEKEWKAIGSLLFDWTCSFKPKRG